VIWAVALSAAALVASGVYLALSRDALRAVVGVSLVSAGANLVVLSAGRVDGLMPAFVAQGPPPGRPVPPIPCRKPWCSRPSSSASR
jgi:multisubunit Na+/H+ antiporter MnhC subunit